MSHFCGLVIMTPEYAENNGFEDSLEKYDENTVIEVLSQIEAKQFEHPIVRESNEKNRSEEHTSELQSRE